MAHAPALVFVLGAFVGPRWMCLGYSHLRQGGSERGVPLRNNCMKRVSDLNRGRMRRSTLVSAATGHPRRDSAQAHCLWIRRTNRIDAYGCAPESDGGLDLRGACVSARFVEPETLRLRGKCPGQALIQTQ